MRVSSITCGLAAALIAAGCGSKGGSYKPTPAKSVEPTSPSALTADSALPLAKGNQWVYSIEVQGVTSKGQRIGFAQDVAWKVVDVKTSAAGGKQATVEFRDAKNAAKVLDRQVWEVNSKGVFQRTMGLKPVRTFNPPIPAILIPATSGRSFEWKGLSPQPFGKPTIATSKSIIQDATTVDTGQESRSGIPVETRTKFPDGGLSIGTTYFVPNVGIARYVHEFASKNGRMVTKMVLKTFRSVQ